MDREGLLTVRRAWLATVPAAVAAASLAVASLAAQLPKLADPFDFFQPSVTVAAAERLRLERGETIVKSVAAGDGQVAIFSASRTAVSGDRLLRWVHRIDAMKRGRYAPAVVRFSDPPQLDDLATLELDADDLDGLRACRPGSCGLKLSETEMAVLVPLARARRAGWQTEVQRAFRAAMLARAERYLAEGLAGQPAYHDRAAPVRLDDEFGALLRQTPFMRERVPGLADFLTRYPAGGSPDIQSFIYWSKEMLGRKPVVSITHVTMARPNGGPEAVVASRQVYASHYMAGSLAITAIVGGRGGAPRYLAYLNRSRVDVLDGFFGGLVRRIVERRLRDEAGQVVDALRRRLEAGEPP